MLYDKQVILKQIQKYELCLVMEKDITDMVAKFSHYKQINQKFFDALAIIGYRCYLTREKYSSTFVCSFNQLDDLKVEFRLHHCEFSGRTPFTWQEILDELARKAYQLCLSEEKMRLTMFDKEKQQVEELFALVNSLNLECFNLNKTKIELMEALDYANK